MKNSILFICLGLLFADIAQAQESAADVVSSAGNYWQSGNLQMEWTIGETMTESFEEAAALLLTQGLHQMQNEITKTPPTVESNTPVVLSINSSLVGGVVTNSGGAAITERGVFWGIDPDPVAFGTQKQIGEGTGTFSDTLTELIAGTTYYMAAYAINSEGISYGETLSFCTILLPNVTTADAADVSNNSAIVGGEVECDGGTDVTESGVYWGTDTNPELTGAKLIISSGIGQFSITLSMLNHATTYYFVAYAINDVGITFGGEKQFTTHTLPTVLTAEALEINEYSARLGGEVLSDGGTAVLERGIYLGTEPDPDLNGIKYQMGFGTGLFDEVVENLDPATLYFIVAYATNTVGTAFGDQISFETLPDQSIPTSLTLDGLTVVGGQDTCFSATATITVAGNNNVVEVNNGGSLLLVAGQSIHLLDGFRVYSGGNFQAWISVNGEFCTNSKSLLATNDEDAVRQNIIENEAMTDPFKLYPNPTTGILTLEFAEKPETVAKVEIFSMIGELIYTTEVSGDIRHSFDLTGNPKGVYIFRVLMGTEFMIEKVIKK
jgi:hypothetical protein